MTVSISAGEALEGLTGVGADLPLRASGSKRELIDLFTAAEILKRQLDALQYALLVEIELTDDRTIGGRHTSEAVADDARLTQAEVRRRMRLAEKVVERTSLTGQEIPAEWEHTATLVRAGQIGDAHLEVIRKFFRQVPNRVNAETRAYAEAELASFAAWARPDELDGLAKRLLATIDPDGSFSEEQDRARKRHFTMKPQGADLMTAGSFCLDPETAAYVEAILAKFARKGMFNPEETNPTLDGQPSGEAIRDDLRTHGQRCHDAVKAVFRDALMSGELGKHRGLPVTVILTATVESLDPANRAPQVGHSGGSLVMPITDILRMARHAENYLAVFDGVGQVELFHGRSRRLATAGQRLVLHASDRGCTFSGCHRGGYSSQVHHANQDWVAGGVTNIPDLTFACDVHHALAGDGPGQWKTRKRNGWTEWVPPDTVDPQRRPRINLLHHPERIIRPGEAA